MRPYLRGHLWELVRLCVDPSKGLQLRKIVMLGKAGRQIHELVIAPLRGHHNSPDLFDLHSTGYSEQEPAPKPIPSTFFLEPCTHLPAYSLPHGVQAHFPKRGINTSTVCSNYRVDIDRRHGFLTPLFSEIGVLKPVG